MNPEQVAGKYVDVLKHSQPQANLLDIKIGKKGKPSTRLIKQIVLTRLASAGCKPQYFKGDTYSCTLDSQTTKFNFRVSASVRVNEWWTNFTVGELTKLHDDYEAVILAVWHPPTEWLKRLMIFAIPPKDVLDGLVQHNDEILNTLLKGVRWNRVEGIGSGHERTWQDIPI
jgi:hypothetical protein